MYKKFKEEILDLNKKFLEVIEIVFSFIYFTIKKISIITTILILIFSIFSLVLVDFNLISLEVLYGTTSSEIEYNLQKNNISQENISNLSRFEIREYVIEPQTERLSFWLGGLVFFYLLLFINRENKTQFYIGIFLGLLGYYMFLYSIELQINSYINSLISGNSDDLDYEIFFNFWYGSILFLSAPFISSFSRNADIKKSKKSFLEEIFYIKENYKRILLKTVLFLFLLFLPFEQIHLFVLMLFILIFRYIEKIEYDKLMLTLFCLGVLLAGLFLPEISYFKDNIYVNHVLYIIIFCLLFFIKCRKGSIEILKKSLK